LLADKAGVVKLDPLAIGLPPVATSYHSYAPPGDVAVNTATVPAQIVVPAATGAAGRAVILTVTGVLALKHPPIIV
jgi:hypothetical protein